MPALPVSSDVDDFMRSADQEAMQAALGVPATADPTENQSETLAINEILLRQKWAMGAEESLIVSSSSFTGDNNGTGSNALINYGQCRGISGTDANGRGGCFSQNGVAALFNTVGGRFGRVDFSKPMWLTVTFSAGNTAIGGGNNTTLSANGFARWTIGRTGGSGALSQKGFGFLLTKNSNTLADVKVITYDSSLHTSASIGTINFESVDSGNGATIHSVTFFIDGTGNLHVWLNDVYKTVIATAPTGESSGAYAVFEVNSGSDTTSNEAFFLGVRSAIKKN